ncbi:hypothetical protein [Jeotgalibacillus campisalis]|uniref:Uncharacterized protein n=1 Tax=Jeotgalibacillus campisalis TaxID=220754 RepID=A0A0C2VQJ2_9BACL|nr:hypothetical protein [Jeotgalibacillus campisalis]KIL51177.1 hypothetical protein KR50_10570 [Jeotgalibacillus campisalis]
MNKTKTSLLFFIAGVLLWLIKITFGLETAIWLTFVLGAAGLIFAVAGRNLILILCNAALMSSVFILMAVENFTG